MRLALFLALAGGQPADDGDLFAVDDDFRSAAEPSVGQASGEPFRRVRSIRLLISFHNYKITYLHTARCSPTANNREMAANRVSCGA
ncbi:Uncharacterised protein [Mycobacteroides abscessus subsp. abscessus]|nr:Uncharacterised protein [Mycobacteroides abscessus subsp. abscessus]